MISYKAQNYRDNKQIGDLSEGEGWIGEAQDFFRVVKLFFMIL